MSMNRLFFLVFIFLLSSCASFIEELDGKPKVNPFDKVEDSSDYQGEWDLYIRNDQFDGKKYYSRVRSIFGGGIFTVITDFDGRRNYINYINGDSYICGNYSEYGSGLTVEHIFSMSAGGNEVRKNMYFSVSNNAQILIEMLGSDTSYIDLLNNYDKLTVRTKDSCGSSIINVFNIRGTTHLVPYVE